jgi:hypothetical protein
MKKEILGKQGGKGPGVIMKWKSGMGGQPVLLEEMTGFRDNL